MRLKNYLLVVEDIEASKKFYREVFGLETVSSAEGSAVLSSSLVLQERGIWEAMLGEKVSLGHLSCELYFETEDLESFWKRLHACAKAPRIVSEMGERAWGQKRLRIFDPDLHLIEIAESPHAVIRRLFKSGMSIGEIAQKTGSTEEEVAAVCGAETAASREREKEEKREREGRGI